MTFGMLIRFGRKINERNKLSSQNYLSTKLVKRVQQPGNFGTRLAQIYVEIQGIEKG